MVPEHVNSLLCLTRFPPVSPPASQQTCKPVAVPENQNAWIRLSEMFPGCWTNYTTHDGKEVHILSLHYTTEVRQSTVYGLPVLNYCGRLPLHFNRPVCSV